MAQTNSSKLRVAMVVIDGNDVSGEHLKSCGYPSPSVHPAILGVIDGLAEQQGLECRVYFGSEKVPPQIKQARGSVSFHFVPYQRIPGLGMGGALLGRFLAIRHAIRKWKPDLVHGQGTEREAGLVAAFCGFPAVLTLHGNFREIEKVFRARPFSYYWVAARLETLVLSKIDHVICISRYVRGLLNNFSCQKTVIPNPVSQKFLEVKRLSPAQVPRVICMGTIDYRKQTHRILEACEQLWKSGHQFTFHVYGNAGYDSDYAADFFERLQAWEEKGVAFREGFSTTPDEVMAQAHVMVSASQEESFGMNVLEAMSAGTPVVAPRTGGILDIMEDGKSGLFFDPGDEDAMAEMIGSLLTDPQLWHQLSSGGRQRAQAGFSCAEVGVRTMILYRQMTTSSLVSR